VTARETPRRNLEETFDREYREQVFRDGIPYPALFRMRFQLRRTMSSPISRFAGRVFKALSSDGPFVMPESPFSISDRRKPLQGRLHAVIVDSALTRCSGRTIAR
jgi:hypothetical protein